jgi:lipoprotein-releasing system permease protein
MNTTLFLALKGLFPYKKFGAPFFWVGTLGVGLGVMILIIVVSVMDGFDATYRQKMMELGGDIRVDATSPMSDPDKYLHIIEKVPGVTAAAPFGQGFMMVEHAYRSVFPVVRGIDPNREGRVIAMDKYISAGALKNLDDESVLLSSLMARQIGAQIGSDVEVYTPLMISKLTREELLLPRSLKVVGTYETGWHDFDQNTMLVSLGTFQELYGLGTSAHGITVRLAPGAKLQSVKAGLVGALPSGFRVQTWKELNKDFLWVLDLERNLMFFLMLFVVIVAAFAMGASQLMTVLRKTKEIGLLMAMGATTGSVAGIYAMQGLILGVVGTLAGNVMGLLILAFRNPMLHAIAGWTGTADTLVEFYQFYDLPMAYTPLTALEIALAAIILTTLSGLIPAFVVSRLKPAETLRNE